jgi:tRNA nucleotidyltransferase (CCA-adding enzyme)
MADPLSPQTWPFSLKWLPEPAYLVGGGVRDALRGCPSPYLDLDFVLPSQAVETAKAIAHHYHAGFVLLDAQRQIARVVFADATVDFAQQVGDSLITDLQRRDFTINAIAYEPHTQELIDPLHGYADLQRQLLRMICPENLAEDPLRLLRAYRQSAQLNFKVEAATQAHIRRLAPHLKQVAAERVRMELSYLLSNHAGTPLLQMAGEDGLLEYWFPSATASNLHQLAAVDTAAETLGAEWPALKMQLESGISDRARGNEASRRTLLSMAKLACLVSQSVPAAIADLQRLKYSRTEIVLVTTLLKCLPQVIGFPGLVDLSRQDLYFLFQTAGTTFPALAVLAIASGVSIAEIRPLITDWLDPENLLAHPPTLITGKDLVEQLQVLPGPAIGHLLRMLEIAQAEGKINTPEAALDLARMLVEKFVPPCNREDHDHEC